jgi:hypothetical protein
MTTKLSVVNEHCTSFMGGIWDISPLLKNVAKNLADLLCHEWPSALDITNELHRLQETVDEYSLSRIWFSAHARVDSTVMMITAPEIRRVSQMIFDNLTPTLWMIVMHSIYYRKLC